MPKPRPNVLGQMKLNKVLKAMLGITPPKQASTKKRRKPKPSSKT